jgi:hypothetical protein
LGSIIGGMSPAFLLANGALVGAQALLVVAPGRSSPGFAGRMRTGRWAFLPPALVVGFVVAGALGQEAAAVLTRVALVAVPLLAAAGLGWAIRGAHPALALLGLPLLVLAWARPGGLPGAAAAAALSAISCVPLGRLLAGAVPGAWLKLGLVLWAVYDAFTVFSSPAHPPDAIVDAAVAGPGLPRFQILDLHAASIGFPDMFVAAVLGGVLAVERVRAVPVALLVFGFSLAFDGLFAFFDTLPATVPVAAALLVSEIVTRRRTTLAAEAPQARRGPAAGR